MLQSDKAVAVGQIPSGLFIVAVYDPATKVTDGYLASFVQQISFSPLMVTLAIKPGRPAYDLIKAGNPFAINIIGDHDKSYLKHFWKGYDANQNPFNELPYHLGEFKGLILDQAKAALECVLVSASKPGDHEVIFAEVKASHVMNAESKSLVHIRKSGADY
ncbi:MAG: flavin reductase family protein [Bdellovibrionales bacterium]|nr:flavin reductase family protein [Bdellovibrionales bacterium]